MTTHIRTLVCSNKFTRFCNSFRHYHCLSGTEVSISACRLPWRGAYSNVNFTMIVGLSTSTSTTRSPPGLKVDINGINIHYEKVGSGAHPVLLLPGALGTSRTDFDPQLKYLNQKRFTLIGWDPPGYGYSIPPERIFSPDFLHKDADLAAALMQKLGFERFSVLGWSDGGTTGMVMASRNPKLVRKLIVWGSNAYITKTDIKIYESVKSIDSWSERMRAPMLALYGKDYFSKTWDGWVNIFIKLFNENQGDICKADLKNIMCPTFIIHGKHDAMIDGEHPNFLHLHIKGSKLHVIPDGKHNIHLRYAKEFNKLVEEFLSLPDPKM